MIVKVQFDAANAAFEEDPEEVGRMLNKAVQRCSDCVATHTAGSGSLRDSWGNTVGSWAVEDES